MSKVLEIITLFRKRNNSSKLRAEIAALRRIGNNSRHLAKNRGAWWL